MKRLDRQYVRNVHRNNMKSASFCKVAQEPIKHTHTQGAPFSQMHYPFITRVDLNAPAARHVRPMALISREHKYIARTISICAAILCYRWARDAFFIVITECANVFVVLLVGNVPPFYVITHTVCSTLRDFICSIHLL